jgi:hypothetical protein
MFQTMLQIPFDRIPDDKLKELWYEICAEARRRELGLSLKNSTPSAPAAPTEAQDSSSSPMHTFPSGAKRSELKPRYDLIPSVPLRRLAARYAMGAERYGEYNWQKGLPISDTLNHVLDHLLKYRERYYQQHHQGLVPQGTPDDDLAAAAWGCFTLMWYEENNRAKNPTAIREIGIQGGTDPEHAGSLDGEQRSEPSRGGARGDRLRIRPVSGSPEAPEGGSR